MSHPIDVTEANYDALVTQAGRPVLLEFWAEWCGPCKTQAPILDDLAENQAHRVTVAKVNVDREPTLAQRFDVRSVPTLVLLSHGQPVHRAVGVQRKPTLEQWLS